MSGGRKPLPPHARRQHGVTCRLTNSERDFVDSARGGVSRGEYIRLAALKAPPRIVPEINREAWASLARTSGNLNQAMAAYNKLGNLNAAEILNKLIKDVAALRLSIIGGQADEN